jgi:hypothetical protein
MASPRRVSARQRSSSITLAANGALHALPANSKGKATARDSGAAMIPPLEDRSSDIEYVGPTASTSTSLPNIEVYANGIPKAMIPKSMDAAAATRSSSEELTDLEVLDKALTPAAKQKTTRKRKSKGKAPAEAPDSVAGAGEKVDSTESKPKVVKKKRTKKIQGPYLPIVQYPTRDLQGK